MNDEELAQVDKAVETADKALKDGAYAKAIQAITALTKIGPVGNLGSYAKRAIEADKLANKLSQQAKTMLQADKLRSPPPSLP